ncbi:MAG: FkbM family methyltransferase, partial [Chryseobacterium sp.]|nr:FkbM family methyltransferase [Chryseobacterium sp.]
LGEASVSEKNGDSKDEVKILRFDDLYQDFEIENLCIVKVDVEGYEEEVLEGMHEFVSKHKPLFVIELWAEKSPKLVEFLKSQGYKRLHIFWFVEEKHNPYISQMYERYNRYHLNYDYE